MSNLLIIRGISGSGKTTLATTKYVPLGYVHLEADMFFITNGVYNFNPAKLGQAHAWCQAQTKQHLNLGHDVVVSNTFTTLWEMKPYLEFARTTPAKLKVIHAQGKFKNVHSVPQQALDRMAGRWEKFDGEEIYTP